MIKKKLSCEKFFQNLPRVRLVPSEDILEAWLPEWLAILALDLRVESSLKFFYLIT